MPKPTKAQLIQIRKESYREQAVECCGTCRHFQPSFSHETVGKCGAIHIKHVIVPINTTYLGKCDLYEEDRVPPQKDGAK